MRRLQGGVRRRMEARQEGGPWLLFIADVVGASEERGIGPLEAAVREGRRRGAARPSGVSGDVFPIPALRQPYTVRGSATQCATREVTNCMIAAVNLLFLGRPPEAVPHPATAAQRRAQEALRAFAAAFVGRGECAASDEVLDDYVQHVPLA